jgi:hypothetical protein
VPEILACVSATLRDGARSDRDDEARPTLSSRIAQPEHGNPVARTL